MDAVKQLFKNIFDRGLSLESQKYIIVILTILSLFAYGIYRGYRTHVSVSAEEEHFDGSLTEDIQDVVRSFAKGGQGASSDFKNCDTVLKIYDKFYADLYDTLFYSKARYQVEYAFVKTKALKSYEGKRIRILDLGCGTGHHVNIFRRNNYECEGVDISPHMIRVAQNKYPANTYTEADFMNADIYEPRTFSHITCFFYTIYYVEDIHRLFENVNRWLKPKGIFALHVVDKRKFDPVLEKSSSLIPFYNPQRHKRKTHTSLKFKDFDYDADWSLDTRPVVFTETFTFPNKRVRRNTHKFNMRTLKTYTSTAEATGFKLVTASDLMIANHPHNYIMFFEKVYG